MDGRRTTSSSYWMEQPGRERGKRKKNPKFGYRMSSVGLVKVKIIWYHGMERRIVLFFFISFYFLSSLFSCVFIHHLALFDVLQLQGICSYLKHQSKSLPTLRALSHRTLRNAGPHTLSLQLTLLHRLSLAGITLHPWLPCGYSSLLATCCCMPLPRCKRRNGVFSSQTSLQIDPVDNISCVALWNVPTWSLQLGCEDLWNRQR